MSNARAIELNLEAAAQDDIELNLLTTLLKKKTEYSILSLYTDIMKLVYTKGANDAAP
ncbi:MAG: hypothetical protein KBF93_20375 [Leptospiraceae bacterium]|nr:hypothetical protein [Leptospiraceae bacterium]